MLEPMKRLSARGSSGRSSRGLTLVELLIGLAVGLFIVAGGVLLLSTQLREHRSVLLEARLTQDLRSAADLIARDLRRAGHWGEAAAGVWSHDAPPLANPYTAVAPAGAASDAASFRYSRDASENHAVDANEQFGYRLRNQAIELQLGSGNWQALTDATLLAVTAFNVTPSVEEIALAELCTQPCPAGSASCPPRQQVRSLAVQIVAHAVADASIARSVRVAARLRNDPILGACAG